MYRFYLGGNKNAQGVFSPKIRTARCNAAVPIYSMNVTQTEINAKKSNGLLSYETPANDGKSVIVIYRNNNEYERQKTYEKLRKLYDMKLVAGVENQPSFTILKNGTYQNNTNIQYDIYVYLDVTEEGKVYPGVELVKIRSEYGMELDKRGVKISFTGVDPFESEYMG